MIKRKALVLAYDVLALPYALKRTTWLGMVSPEVRKAR